VLLTFQLSGRSSCELDCYIIASSLDWWSPPSSVTTRICSRVRIFTPPGQSPWCGTLPLNRFALGLVQFGFQFVILVNPVKDFRTRTSMITKWIDERWNMNENQDWATVENDVTYFLPCILFMHLTLLWRPCVRWQARTLTRAQCKLFILTPPNVAACRLCCHGIATYNFRCATTYNM